MPKHERLSHTLGSCWTSLWLWLEQLGHFRKSKHWTVGLQLSVRKAELDCSQGGKTTAAEKRLEEMKAQIAAKRDVVSLWCQDVPRNQFWQKEACWLKQEAHFAKIGRHKANQFFKHGQKVCWHLQTQNYHSQCVFTCFYTPWDQVIAWLGRIISNPSTWGDGLISV